jgi:DNA-binding transcriptional MocR family regulator
MSHAPAVAPEVERPSPPTTVSEWWLSLDLFAQHRNFAAAGCGWLPADWRGESHVTEALRHAARIPNERVAGYGTPRGFQPLRQHLARGLADRMGSVSADQLVLTHGATHALDLVIRTLLRPGDAVLVESPGYCNLIALLRHHGCRLLPVPRGSSGLCIDTVHLLAAQHRPKALFLTTVLQNPLSVTLSAGDAHRLLSAAERHDFRIVEDDTFRDLGTGADTSLAGMDGLRRVIEVGSFSKSVSPAVRVGHIACPAELVEPLLRTKMLTGLTTSEVNERCVYEVVSHPGHRRSLDRLRARLTSAREALLGELQEAGLTLEAEPAGGMFVSAGWKVAPTQAVSARTIADAAIQAGVALAPAEFFEVGPPASIWFRFNVAYADDPRLMAWLRSVPERFGLRS